MAKKMFITRAGRGQQRQGFLVLLFPSKSLEELSLTLQQAEGATEASVKHIMNTWHIAHTTTLSVEANLTLQNSSINVCFEPYNLFLYKQETKVL